MSSTVWVVEQGEYSDYRVVGVFTSEANARLVADAINKPEDGKYTFEDATVVEWPLDPAVDDISQGRRPHVVTMLRDGVVERCEAWTITGGELAGRLSIWRRTEAPVYKGRGIPDALHGTVWAKDVEHAIKIANEKRAQLIASGEWDAE